MPLIAADMRRLKSRNIDSIPLFAGVGSMLQELSQAGVVIAMVSSDSESNVRRALGDHAALISAICLRRLDVRQGRQIQEGPEANRHRR